MFFQIVRIILYIPLFIFVPSRVKGRRNIPKGRCILVCNHTSAMDAIVLLHKVRRKMFLIGKKELFRNKFMAWFLPKVGAISVDRENLDITAIKTCLSVLKKEKILTIFPEGHRNRGDVDTLQEIKNGAAMLAIKSGSPIVPVWFKGKTGFFRFSRVYIGKPFALEQIKADKESISEAGKILGERLIELSESVKKRKKIVKEDTLALESEQQVEE